LKGIKVKPSGKIRIGEHWIGNGEPTFVIAEIGINHNGNVEIAKELVREAKKAGCQAVKFQKRTVDVVYSAEELAKPREVPPDIVANAAKRGVLSPEAVRRLENSDWKNTTNGDLKRALELTRGEYEEIDRCAKDIGILWFASPWDENSVDFLEQFDPPCYKVASASLTDWELLRYIKGNGKPVIMSTGMSTLEQVERAAATLGHDNLALMHCVSTYPSELKEINLKVIETLYGKFASVPIGYSGHERGIAPSLCAVAMGACAVERHFTLNRAMWGSDQKASIEPAEMTELVKLIRDYETAKGDGAKRLLESEIPIMKKLRRK
jgi:N-acetylneuraminate synthase